MASLAPSFLYDPSTLEFQEAIWDVYRTMRDEHPVYRDPGGAFFALSRFEDVSEAARDWETFSSIVPEATSLLPQMIFMDPPRHTALRRLVSHAFTPRRLAQVEPFVRETSRDLIAHVAERGVCDAQHEFAAVVPSLAIARLIGVPPEHIGDFRSWTRSFIEITGKDDYAEAAANIYGLFAELLTERRRAPAGDLMTALLDAEVDGQRLSDDELLGFCLLLILAGNDTTSSLIGSGIALLARDPVQRARLLADPSLWPNAVEELNRVESPTQALSRTLTREVALHGVTIPAGSRVMLLWGAANHDEREFPDPERFDVTRQFSRHLAFSHGVHFCLGANLARIEARAALEEWHARFPEYELDGEPVRARSMWARAHRLIPVRVQP
ncbi:MAG: cytochrome P450 [Acidimicrobiales bacterium]